ncbi:AMP-binding protein [Methylocystis sp.]|uniref:AMP-binding protein n=1 Tax=Methylocystis sp. TaxID=1911079 RepID=UPI002732DEAD|nr:AMP-binding protein [Methylocystis sp.]MDP3555261.1 AMP-binding protein [Methylocystis sp.]
MTNESSRQASAVAANSAPSADGADRFVSTGSFNEAPGVNTDKKYKTISELLRIRAANRRPGAGFRFLNYDSPTTYIEESFSYSELLAEASAVAGVLQLGCPPGGRALILCPPGTDYIAAFFACQLAGVVAVPAYPPRNPRHMDRLEAIIGDCGAAAILASSNVIEKIERWKRGDAHRHIVDVSLARRENPASLRLIESSPDSLAFLQYTSGTTGQPKGVMVTQAAALENVRQIIDLSRCGEEDSGVLWLPPFHDMGLVAGLLVPLAAGFPITLMSPASFCKGLRVGSRPCRTSTRRSPRRPTSHGVFASTRRARMQFVLSI